MLHPQCQHPPLSSCASVVCIHDAPFLDQCLMCILLHSCILYSMTFLRILHAFCAHLCPSLSDTYSTTLCISLAFYVHLALQCSLARAFSVHLISILAHFVHCCNDLHAASWGARASHELHVLLLSVAVVHDILSHFECIPPHSKPSAALALSSVHS